MKFVLMKKYIAPKHLQNQCLQSDKKNQHKSLYKNERGFSVYVFTINNFNILVLKK